ncbi:MAG: V-type ATP synthase subunit E family protein [Candidatus Pelethousia sp.]|nr:V-type ATP synthase subunit E family protein [Candidatus Pelethousia sp.]
MAKDLNNGERLLSSIVESAKAEAEAALAEARARAQAQADETAAEAGRILAEAEDRAKASNADILERSRTNALLDARKQALADRRAVIDEAFEAAAAQLNALAGPEREAILEKLLLSSATGGETILPAQADAEALSAVLPGVNAKLAALAKAPLALGQHREEISGGFVLAGESYEINCSFEAVLRDLRRAEESGVAALLFG